MTSIRVFPRTRSTGVEVGGRAFVLAGTIATIGYALVGTGSLADFIFVATSVGSAAAVVVGIRRNRPALRPAWFHVGAVLVILAVANVMAALARVPELASIRGLAETLFMVAYLPLFVAAWRFGRTALRSDWSVLIDTAIVALAAIPVVWEVVVEPYLPSTGAGPAAVLAIAVPVVDIVLLSLVAPMTYVRTLRSASSVLLLLGILAVGIGDSIYALGTLQPISGGVVATNLAWLAFYVLLGGAALVPSAATLGVAREPEPGSADRSRTFVLAAAVLTSPLLVLHEAIGTANAEVAAFATLALAGAALLILRLQRTIGDLGAADRRFRRFMEHEGLVAVIKDGSGRYRYMNPTAAAGRGLTSKAWYGRTDEELFAPDVAARRRASDDAVRAKGSAQIELVEDGARTWLSERFPMPGTRGGIGVIGLDVTERVQAERAAQFQARLLESVRDSVIVVDPEGTVRYWNRGAEEILGYSSDEMVGQGMAFILPPSTMDEMAGRWEDILRGEVVDLDWLATRRDGGEVWLQARVAPLFDESGALTGFLSVAKDVTARKEAEIELARLGGAIDHATDGVIVTDEADRVVYVNPAFVRITGLSAFDLRERPMAEISLLAPFRRGLEQALARKAWRGDVVTRRRDGSDLVCATTISAVSSEADSIPGFVTIIRDVTLDRAAERSEERRARERALVAEVLTALHAGQTPEETARAVCNQIIKLPELAVGSVITFGPDGIATVIGQELHDGVGQPGLPLSEERSRYLRERAAGGPWVDRWSPAPGHPYADLFEESGIVANAYAPMMVGGAPIGVLVAGSDRIDAMDRLIERLPALVQFAAIATTLLGGAVADRNAVAADLAELRRIIDAGSFSPVFQPIVDLASGAVRGYEALTRFNDGTRPDVRFEQAHRLGAGLELEAACLVAAFEAAEALPAGAWLNVNVSPEAILAGAVGQVLPSGGRELLLELTEHQAITDYVTFRAAMAPLRDRVRLAIDDAGAGFASLRHIVELAPAMVKLDRSLVEGIGDDAARQAVVAGMVRFANAAGLTLLAEGIETESELALLRDLGVQLGQGYLLGRPAAVEDFTGTGKAAGADGEGPAAAAA